MGFSSLSVPPCPLAGLSPAHRAGDLFQSCGSLSLCATKKSQALAFIPPIVAILFSQMLSLTHYSESYTTGALLGCLYFLSHLWLCVHWRHRINTTQHCSFPFMGYHWHRQSLFSLLFLYLKLIAFIYHPAFPAQFALFQSFPDSGHLLF